MKKLLLLLLFCLSLQILPAQQKIILEELRCWALRNATMAYWKNEEVRKVFAGQLNSLLLKHQHLPLADTTKLNIHNLNDNPGQQKIPGSVRYKDTVDLHMYLDIFENSPSEFFSYDGKTSEDSVLMARAKTVFQLALVLEKGDKNIVFKSTLDMVVSAGNTPGMGIESGNVAMMPRGFTEMLKHGLNILLNPENDVERVDMKIAPAFISDNYILSKIIKQPRVYVSTTKDISSYAYHNNGEMIRMGQAVYEEAKRRGKKGDQLPDALMDAIRKTDHFSSSDYVFLKQDCRDVLQNKDYLLKMIVQIDPENPPAIPNYLFTNFLAGHFHYLFNEKDTVALFTVEKAVRDPDKKLFTNKISNGFDSASYFLLDITPPVWPIVYHYVIKGTIQKQDFSIKCSGFSNTIKEIYLNNTLICIAQGKFSPEKFVVFDASLSPGLLNQLFMIGFNRFFE